ncbi:MAG: DUF86 domain-containing protein [Methanohalobium sp.]|uniref:HepT-like ribonuclease domain-containing protein n=1 Tax=Methanohalobium sp. TaxID=2837493 RepID=UPI00397B62A2
MKRDAITYLQDILDAANKVENFTSRYTYDQFLRDDKTQYAVMMAVEIIGEATKNIPQHIKDKYPSVPWKDISGMRDKIVHGYFSVDIEILWTTAKNNIPSLIPMIEQVLNNESKNG